MPVFGFGLGPDFFLTTTDADADEEEVASPVEEEVMVDESPAPTITDAGAPPEIEERLLPSPPAGFRPPGVRPPPPPPPPPTPVDDVFGVKDVARTTR